MRRPVALIAAGLLAPVPAAAETTVRLAPGFDLEPYVLAQLDAGSFGQDREGGQAAGVNFRRLRLGGRLRVQDQVELGLIWDFSGPAGSKQALFEAKASYIGLDPFRLTAGVFHVDFGLESTQSASNTLFLERASIVTITRNLAAGIRREAVELGADGDRWNAAAALTAGQAGPAHDGDQRAVTARVAALVHKSEDLALHLGLSGEHVFRGARPAGAPSITLSDREELQIDDVRPALSTGPLRTNRITAIGPEFGLAWRRLWLSGEYYALPGTLVAGPSFTFDGWYLQAAYTILGTPRAWSGKIGGWGAPKPATPFDPARNQWGAVELAARVSAVDLNSGTIRGGRQNTVTAGLNWWPLDPLRFSVQYGHATIAGTPARRTVDSVAARAQLQF